jgi:hypothetical protein
MAGNEIALQEASEARRPKRTPRASTGSRFRQALPWLISLGLLVYVFGFATDWRRLRAALEAAHVPLFVAFVAADRLGFFTVWTLFQALAVRRLVAHVPLRSVFAVRGGAELIRTISAPASDAAFFLGLSQLSHGALDAVLSAALLPALCHFLVMLSMMTAAMWALPGGIAGNRGVFITAGVMWSILLAVAVVVRISRTRKLRWAEGIRRWLEQLSLRELRPFLLGFLGLTLFDVCVQYAASRAFGVDIPWIALAARIPMLYLALTIPTLGNFGTREVAWANLFQAYGERDRLVAYALATNSVFLVINLALGLIFLRRALQLLAAVRRARREGEPVPEPLLHDPTDL